MYAPKIHIKLDKKGKELNEWYKVRIRDPQDEFILRPCRLFSIWRHRSTVVPGQTRPYRHTTTPIVIHGQILYPP